MNEFIRKCRILREMREKGLESGRDAVSNYFANGMEAPGLVHPENVIAWVSSDNSGLDGEYVHQRMILKILLEGHVRTLLDGQPRLMTPGTAALFFPYQVHASQLLDAAENYSFAAVTFTLNASDMRRIQLLKNRIFPFRRDDEKDLLQILAGYQN